MDCGTLKATGSVAVVGAGPGGAMLARLLGMRGYRVTVYERDAHADARPQGGSLDLRPDSGQRAVAAAGLVSQFAAVSREEASAFRMLDVNGRELPGAGQDTHEDAGPEVDRGDLRKLLLDSLDADTLRWNHRLDRVTAADDGRWILHFANQPPATADLVIGADGMGSRVRRELTDVEPIYTGITMVAGVIRPELWRGSPLSELLGEGSVMFADGSKTVFVQRCAHDLILLYFSMAVPKGWPQAGGIDADDTQAMLGAVRDAYAGWPPHVMDMLTDVRDGLHLWPTSVLPPDHRWTSRPGLTILGDAAHAMPPFTGKGVNLALLDALELADRLDASPERDVGEAVAGFERGMQARTRRETRACLQVGASAYGMDLGFDLAAAD